MAALASVLRFGRHELRPAERRLLIDGKPAPVGARAFDVLVALIERRDRVVSSNELFELVWPEAVVEENNLRQQVSALRKLLGAAAIGTIPGRGYRFTAPLDEGTEGRADPDRAGVAPTNDTAETRSRTNLPRDLAPLYGRTGELDELRMLLEAERLVTIVGAGGIGKSRLAQATAHSMSHRWVDGTCWVDLTSITDPTLVATTVSQAMEFPRGRDETPLCAVVARLKTMQVLVVMDNAEHLATSVATVVQRVLSEAAEVRILVTSQVPLKVETERLFRLGTLAIPDEQAPPAEASGYGSVALFVNHCQALDRGFELHDANVAAVIRVCRQLDGLPLAIKLAAARLRLLGLQGLEARLGMRLKLLVANSAHVPVRQRTLAATLDWSHGLLATRDQVVLRRLSVFIAGFDLELAAAVAGERTDDELDVVDSLEVLVDRSLVEVDRNDPPRYLMLESTRLYAIEQALAAGEFESSRHRHAMAMARLLERADDESWSSPEIPWFAKYGPELGNARVAMDWCMENDAVLGLTLAGAAGFLFLPLGLRREYGERSDAIEARMPADTPDRVLARYCTARCLALWGVDHPRLLEYALKAQRLYRSLGDERGLVVSLYCAAISGLVAGADSDKLRDDLARMDWASWPPRLRALVKVTEFELLYWEGRYEDLGNAVNAFMSREGATSPAGLLGNMFNSIANWKVLAEVESGNFDQAVDLAWEVVRDARAQNRGDSMLTVALGNLTRALLGQRSIEDARATLLELFESSRSDGWHSMYLYSDLCTLLALQERRLQTAAMLMGYSDRAWGRIGQQRSASGIRFGVRTKGFLAHALGASVLAGLKTRGADLNEEDVCTLTLSFG